MQRFYSRELMQKRQDNFNADFQNPPRRISYLSIMELLHQQVIEQFIGAINAHDAEMISRLLCATHKMIDAQGHLLSGGTSVSNSWEAYFKIFPDYHIKVQQLYVHEDTVSIFGTASGSYKGMKNEYPDSYWEIPAAWRASVMNDLVESWQIFADTAASTKIIDKYHMLNRSAPKVNGLGGVFLNAENPKELAQWYDKHLGTRFGTETYFLFKWRERFQSELIGSTTFSFFHTPNAYFEPSQKPYMLNFRVAELHRLLEDLKAAGVWVAEKTETYEYGRFGWIMDPEGNKIELWEPNDAAFD